MIFISHTHDDKPIVEPIALRLAQVFGDRNVFYDSWSIQPGDGTVNKMNEALTKCKFFFFFVSKKSLLSEMVKLEWQNAIIKATNGNVKLIPVKVDDCIMPAVLLQSLYIDLYGKGQEIALRQIIDVVNGSNTFREQDVQEFQNIRGYISKIENGYRIEFRAEAYMEPQSKFMLLVKNNEEEVECTTEGYTMPNIFVTDWKILNTLSNAFIVSRPNATSPGFPFVVKLLKKSNAPIDILGLLRAVPDTQARSIPVIEGNL
jgi:hypothetical protein